MKCQKCGADLAEDSVFCRECGTKITRAEYKKKFCRDCGYMLDAGMKFCPNCGVSIEAIPELGKIESIPEEGSISMQTSHVSRETKQNEKTTTYQIPSIDTTNTCSQNSTNPPNDVKIKLLSLWERMDLFNRIAAISATLFVIFLFVSLCTRKAFPIALSAIQLVSAVLAVLMHKGTVKQNNPQIKYVVLVMAILLSLLNVASYSWEIDRHEAAPLPEMVTHVAETTSEIVVVSAPCGSEDCIGKNGETVYLEFSQVGFTNVSYEDVEDLTLAEADNIGNVESVLIEGSSQFSMNQQFNANAKVVVRKHAYKKCKVELLIDFVPNLILSKYDVNLEMNDEFEAYLTHGEDRDLEFVVDPGKYTFTFTSAESSYAKGGLDLQVDCDIELAVKISCHSDYISVKTLYTDRKAELEEGEIKLTVPASEYINKNSSDVTAELEKLGFTNIRHEVLYDIVYGWTKEKEVKSVTIDGVSDFTRGSVFKADAEIVIVYHMPETSDPSRIAMTADYASYIGMNYQIVEKAFKDLGFSNVVIEKSATNDVSEVNGSTYSVSIASKFFDTGDSFKTTDQVIIKYYEVEKTPTITVVNNSDFKKLMEIKDQTDAAAIQRHLSSLRGSIIEFNGIVALMMQHGDYKTRFDVCLAGGDGTGKLYGPLFSFEDVAFHDMHVSGADEVAPLMLFHVTAKILGYNSEGNYVTLKPISMEAGHKKIGNPSTDKKVSLTSEVLEGTWEERFVPRDNSRTDVRRITFSGNTYDEQYYIEYSNGQKEVKSQYSGEYKIKRKKIICYTDAENIPDGKMEIEIDYITENEFKSSVRENVYIKQ